ncbi:MAG: hypothetical protein ACAH80_13770 [Alphaproteobacteria bacterium]
MRAEMVKSFLRFLVVGLFTAGIGEWWFSGGDLSRFLNDMAIAALYLSVACLADRQLSKVIYPHSRAAVASYCLFGLFGLVLFSWLLLRHDPWRSPDTSQVSLFCYWAAIVFLPRSFNELSALAAQYRKRMLYYGFTMAAITTIGGSVLDSPVREMFFDPGVFFTYGGVNLIYWRYLWKLDRAAIQTPADVSPEKPAS